MSQLLYEFASKSVKDTYTDTVSSENGLSTFEAESRLARDGKNNLGELKKRNIIVDFLNHFKNPLIIILVIAAIFSYFFSGNTDADIIIGLIVLSVCLDFYLERDASKAAAKLKRQVETKVTCMRDGIKNVIPSEYLVEGDIVFLSAGSLVPADCKIIDSNDIFVNQSALTGESFPVEKDHNLVSVEKTGLTDLKNILFLGTNIVTGSCKAIVIATGKKTEYGKIAKNLEEKPQPNEFDRGVNAFSMLISKAIIFLVIFIFIFNMLLKHEFIESFLFAIAIAIGLTPELLPMIMSVSMARGSLRMAKKGVIVKRLQSLPNFGSMDVLCTDKTGTLTQDKIKLVKYTDAFGRHSENVYTYAYLNSFYQTGIKNPLDDAVLEYRSQSPLPFTKVDEIPFDFIRKKMSVVVASKKSNIMITKGAPEEIMQAVSFYNKNGKSVRITTDLKKRFIKQSNEFFREGYRVLAVSIKEVNKRVKYTKDDEREMTLIGFVAFLDPPKEDVKEVVSNLLNKGIEIKIVTGDNELVTQRICNEISLPVKGILLGSELQSLSDEALRVRVENTTIFARFSPDEKNRVIKALKDNDHVVGYMGDGINDAPSLRTADVGISVNSAVDVAKEAAGIILTEKSFNVLMEGINEGRKTFVNTMKYIMMNLSSNFGNMFSVAGAILFLPFLPMLPMQILLNNLIYDFSQITIPGDNVDANSLNKPKKWNVKSIRRFMLLFGPTSSFFDFVTFFVLFFIFGYSTVGSQQYFQTAWFMESMASQTLVILFIRSKKLPFINTMPAKALTISTLLCVAIGWILPFTHLGKYFNLVPLPPVVVITIAGIVFMYLVYMEVAKRIFFKNEKDNVIDG